MKTKLVVIALSIFLAFIVFFTGFIVFPLGNRSGKTEYFEIKNGESLSRIAANLEKENLIHSKTVFKWTSIFLGKRKSIKSGDYEIKGPVSILSLIRLLNEGKTILVKMTFPEGLRMDEIFNLLEANGFGVEANYQQLCRNRKFIESIGLPANITSLEGFLFPETYFFSKHTSPDVILRTMVKSFFQNIPPDYAEKAKNIDLSFYEAIILASIIEKETGVSSERKLIASVFHNRLKKNMRLQTDPTVIYGIKDFNGNLTRKQLRSRNPYNTYYYKGLPPTPIANPGLASLLSAVHPAKTNYLYFVAKGDGTHKFTSNYRDHNHAVTRYQLHRTRNYKSF